MATMTIYSAAITLFLVMDPLGNVPIFLSILNPFDSKRRAWIILRESMIAFVILTVFMFAGQRILNVLHITTPALGIAGGIILFLIAIKLIFPPEEGSSSRSERQIGEPFIVPLAIPLTAGPSALATVLLIATQHPDKMGHWFLSLVLASSATTVILLFSGILKKILGEKGLIAMERLMEMLLPTVAVQMVLTGIQQYLGK